MLHYYALPHYFQFPMFALSLRACMNLYLIAIKFQGFSDSPLAPCVACPVWELLTQMCAVDVPLLLMAAQPAHAGSSKHFTSRSGGSGSPVGGACWVPAG